MNKLKLIDYCQQLHIHAVGIAPWPLPMEEARRILFEQDPCPFTASELQARLQGNTTLVHPRCAIVCLFPYYVPTNEPTNIARYTWATDYHLVVPHYLSQIISYLQQEEPSAEFEIHCDTSPLADRYMAYLAGLGFYGKNHCFIHPSLGSYVVIGTILTSIPFEPDRPLHATCLGCNRCLQACPGQALQADHFHYHTCKSYLTQKKGDLSETEQQIIGKTPLLFGCDICQEVCPHNAHLPITPFAEFRHIDPQISTEELANMTNKQFKERYGHRAFSWRGKKILLRNEAYIKSKKDST